MARLILAWLAWTLATLVAVGGSLSALAQTPPPFAPPDPNMPPPLAPAAPPVATPPTGGSLFGPPPLGPDVAQPPPGFSPPIAPSAPAGPAPALISGQLLDTTRILAYVGDQAVLAGDLLPQITAAMKQFEGRMSQTDMERQRELGFQQLLPQAVEQKLLFLDFLKLAPPERLPEIYEKLNAEFDKSKLKPLMKSLQVETVRELEEKLREFGSSIEKQRRRFAEQTLAQEMIKRNIDFKEEVTFDEMLRYYREHIAEYQYPEQVRWEGMSISFDRVPDKRQAYREMAALGNQVLGGAKFEEVARRGSHGPDAVDGGQHDWTGRGVLASKAVDEAIFALPIDKLSPILEDAQGFYIVRVKERKAAGAESFETAQIGIKEKIRRERIKAQSTEYIARLKEKTRVWTIYDAPGQPGGQSGVTASGPGAERK